MKCNARHRMTDLAFQATYTECVMWCTRGALSWGNLTAFLQVNSMLMLLLTLNHFAWCQQEREREKEREREYTGKKSVWLNENTKAKAFAVVLVVTRRKKKKKRKKKVLMAVCWLGTYKSHFHWMSYGRWAQSGLKWPWHKVIHRWLMCISFLPG